MVKLVALSCVFGLGMCFALLGSISIKLMPRLKIDKRKFGTLVTVFMLSCLFSSLIIGAVVDLAGYRLIAGVGFALAALCTLGLANAKLFGTALTFCSGLGLGAIALNIAGNTLLPQVLFEGKNHAAALNLGNVCFGLGLLLTPLVVSFLFQRLSYERSILVIAGVLLIPFPIAASATYPFIKTGFQLGDVLALSTNGTVLVAALMLFCYTSLETSFCSWLPIFGKEVFSRLKPDAELNSVDAPAQRLLSLFAIGIMTGRLIASQIPKITSNGHWYIAAAAALAGVTILTMTRCQNAVQARMAAVVSGLALAPIFPTLAGVTFSRFNPDAYGSITGLMFGMGFLGASIAPTALGRLASGSSVQRSLSLLLPLSALLVVLSFVLTVTHGQI